MERIRIDDAEPPFVRQICLIVNLGNNEDTRNVTFQAEIRKLFENVQVFNDTTHVEDYLKTLTEENVAFLIVIESIDQRFISQIHLVECIAAIYLFSRKRKFNESWIENFSKVDFIDRSNKRFQDRFHSF